MTANIPSLSRFYDSPKIHDEDALADVFDNCEIVGDKEISDSVSVLKILKKIDDLGLYRNVKRADRFITNDQPGFHREGSGNSDSLTLASAQLMRITASV